MDSWIEPGTEHENYQSLAMEILGRETIGRLAKGLLVVLDHGNVYNQPTNQETPNLYEDFQWVEDQQRVIDTVINILYDYQGCRILVTGAADMGNSAVIEQMCTIVKDKGVKPICLDLSGVAAVNIKGQTLHRWFRDIKMGGHHGFPNCNSTEIREQLMDIYDKGLGAFFLIDEASVIPGTMLTAISTASREACDEDSGSAFGGWPDFLTSYKRAV